MSRPNPFQKVLAQLEAVKESFPHSKAVAATFVPLAQALHKSPHRQATFINSRCEIVNEDLCSDTFKALAPTLDQYKGQDTVIIDINPGSCLWSTRLNDYLKPKRHVLLEPEEHYFRPFIEPLLSKPGSTYTHSYIPGVHAQRYWDNWTHILHDSKLLPPREELQSDDPARRRLTTNLLITGNLYRHPLLSPRSRGMVPPVNLILKHMGDAALHNYAFQSSGLVRMLFWVPSEAVKSAIPADLEQRKATNTQMNFSLDMAQVMAAPYVNEKASKKKFIMEDYPSSRLPIIAQQTKALRKEQRIARTTWPNNTTQYDTKSLKGPNPLDTSCKDFAELQQHVQQSQDVIDPLESIASSREVRSKAPSAQAESFKRKLNKLVTAFRYPYVESAVAQSAHASKVKTRNRIVKVAAVLNADLHLLHLESELAALTQAFPDHPELEQTKDMILDLGKTIHDKIESLFEAQTLEIARVLLIRLHAALMTTRPVIARDQRHIDPFVIQPDEFFPPREMSLLMLSPREHTLQAADHASSHKALTLWPVFVKILFATPNKGLPYAMQRFGHYAQMDLLPLVPGLSDPRQGARLNPDLTLPRTLTWDVMWELFQRYLAWPFRPSDAELYVWEAHTSGPAFDGEEEEDLQQSEDNVFDDDDSECADDQEELGIDHEDGDVS